MDDAELINNYILIGYDRNVQDEIEKNYWIDCFEKNTTKEDKSYLNDFFRHYLSLETGRWIEARRPDTEHSIFVAFKEYFKKNGIDLKDEATLRQWCEKWKGLSACYSMLLNPVSVSDDEIQEYLGTLNTFGESAHPFLMAVLNDYEHNNLDRSTLLQILHLLETYYFRHAVCGIDHRKIVTRMASLYNTLDKTSPQRYFDTLSQKLFIGIPSDDLVRQVLRTECKSHETGILIKLDKKTNREIEAIKEKQKESNVAVGIDLEHIFPCNPENEWNNGEHICSDEEKKQMSVLLNSIGNWLPLEKDLNIRASNLSFPDKKEFYQNSRFEMVNTELFTIPVWNVKAIEDRTERLTDAFLSKWKMPNVPGRENDPGLISIFDVPFRVVRNCYNELRYSQAEFQGKAIQAANIKELYLTIIPELWKQNRDAVLAANDRVDPGYRGIGRESGNTSMPLDAGYYLYTGFWHCYFLQSLRSLLAEMNLANELFVKYAEGE